MIEFLVSKSFELFMSVFGLKGFFCGMSVGMRVCVSLINLVLSFKKQREKNKTYSKSRLQRNTECSGFQSCWEFFCFDGIKFIL